MKHFRTCVLLIATLSLSAAENLKTEAQTKSQPVSDFEALQGKWQAVQMTWGGDTIPAESCAKLRLAISGQWYSPGRGPIRWLARGKNLVMAELPEMDGVFTIDAGKSPKTIVIYPPQRNLALHLPGQGIYRLEGDTLTVCFGSFGESPLAFDDKTALQFVVYKRVPQAVRPAK